MAFHLRTVIQSGIFSKAEDTAFTNAIGNYACVSTSALPEYFYKQSLFRDCFFRGSVEALSQCPYSLAHLATPMYVFNWMYFTRYIPPDIFVNFDWQAPLGRDLPISKPLFIRSATGDKRLPGDTYTFDNKIEIEIAKATYDDISRRHKYDILIIASPKQLQQEQRYVIYKNEVLTGSEYITREGKVPRKYSAISDLSVADSLLKQSTLDKITALQNQPYTLDIAYVDGIPKILEINSFWCAGMYGCNVRKVISTLEKNNYFK